ncbi:MAG: 2-C-methyl-D-erythritol 2,4-cyclodiphosphate synthase [Candidatus Aquicultorales bacterium]
MRIGIGYDSHRFEKGRPLMLGGVEVPYEFGLAGWSDADVLLHAIIDSLLGAACAGDIGELFPDTDPAFKGASSLELLKETAKRIGESGFSIENVDSVVVLEEPKLREFKEAMRLEIAGALGISVERVSVKAKTSEGMGFVGRKEGIIAQAVALLEKR